MNGTFTLMSSFSLSGCSTKGDMASKYANDVPPDVDRLCVTGRRCSSIADVVPGRCIIVPTKLLGLLSVSSPTAGGLKRGEGVETPTKLLCRELGLLPLPEVVFGRLEEGEINDGNFADEPKADLTDCTKDDFVDMVGSGLSLTEKYSNGVRSNCGLPFVVMVILDNPKKSAFALFLADSKE